jgi:hypothetical protein
LLLIAMLFGGLAFATLAVRGARPAPTRFLQPGGIAMRLSLFCLTVLLASASPDLVIAQTKPADRRVVALREATLKSGASAAEFERFFADSVARPLNRHIPGVHAYLLKGERGARVGGYVIVYEFQSLARRNAYFPRADTTSALYERLAKAVPPNSMENLSRYVDVAAYTDYVVVR